MFDKSFGRTPSVQPRDWGGRFDKSFGFGRTPSVQPRDWGDAQSLRFKLGAFYLAWWVIAVEKPKWTSDRAPRRACHVACIPTAVLMVVDRGGDSQISSVQCRFILYCRLDFVLPSASSIRERQGSGGAIQVHVSAQTAFSSLHSPLAFLVLQ